MKKIITILLLVLVAGRIAVAQSIQGMAFEDAIPDGQDMEKSALVYFKYIKYSDREPDTLKVSIWDYYFGQLASTEGQVSKRIPLRKGSMLEGLFPSSDRVITVNISDLQGPSYISLSLSSNETFNKYLIFPGDSIKIYSQPFRNILTFGGPSAPLFECQRALNNHRQAYSFQRAARYTHRSQSSLEEFLEKNDNRLIYEQALQNFGEVLSLPILDESYLALLQSEAEQIPIEKSLLILDSYQSQLSKDVYEILLANEIGLLYNRLVLDWSQIYIHSKKVGNQSLVEKLEEFYFNEIGNLNFEFEEETIKRAIYYQEFLINQSKAISQLKQQPLFVSLANYQENVRDFLIGRYIIGNYRTLSNGSEVLEKALSSIEEPNIRPYLEKLYHRQGAGQPIENFEFENLNGEKVKLEDFEGKTVLLDFWFTGCKACINFYEAHLHKVEKHFEGSEDFVLISISMDSDYEKWKKSVEGGRYSSPTGINLYTNGEGFDHSFLKQYNIVGAPHQLLIDGEGRMVQSGGLQLMPEELVEILEEVLAEGC
ncbi:thiol-disulfide isomerase-like thioredoxin [Belliella baltica DSM 15883]|uniref:Thiol-disulfide isomerase-like thioredoxin n=1 Tax=Belliella baltica (strain DSM 15883 / CIP 108006 / LMG 21964 / BA134) TaxID=866536 RepID=I3Z779_BELBD|nr:TlpA disulfide reductase family protein [Belliella baltica]AFL85097.1 thiol-disulfide isomerase-like thioredoxin [Belliella baltica DSM 15883]